MEYHNHRNSNNNLEDPEGVQTRNIVHQYFEYNYSHFAKSLF